MIITGRNLRMETSAPRNTIISAPSTSILMRSRRSRPEAAAIANSQAGTFSAEGDATSLNSQEGNLPDISFNGAYSITDTNLGHGSGTLPAGFFGYFQSNAQIPVTFYMIAPNQFVLIGAENGANSGIAFFDPE
jgi:hypothetical protein